ncbi:MAG: hypothetical protein ABIH21_03545, partial [Patescibacteria group bacterium]
IAWIIQADLPLLLTVFTCSTIQADQMFSQTPWNYVSLDPAGNNLTPDIKRLGMIVEKMRAIYPNT